MIWCPNFTHKRTGFQKKLHHFPKTLHHLGWCKVFRYFLQVCQYKGLDTFKSSQVGAKALTTTTTTNTNTNTISSSSSSSQVRAKALMLNSLYHLKILNH